MLDAAGLPSSDLTDAHLEHFFYAGPPDAPVGIVGLELLESDALLRSLVVDNTQRSRGLGRRLVEVAEQHAREHGVSSLFLLTTTAESFFLKQGFVATSRAEAPAAIKTSVEFSTLCPASSAFLVKPVHSRRSS